ncbi:hypothetical protein HN51_034645 [Arachis hypogaea]|uniref:uncharacterized protein LOC107629599 isoform X1 n=1 Tax=Arachis ipaensis TaxID=130454 RepID=UPI0007AF0914|nr:uncharacterized protein LOC107629599 isoform X1 [Arachis ipaensis]XP_025642685.1 uncharacterized protein LOC112737127 isoform X1 [Arachis hypogaea]QHN99496.1 uncharacterized protein DS421_13g398330 [Arachis hypogaea]QHN99497.1 uncharacterized protein DS421_13g398330 [Arachis hypogaea]
MGERKANPKMRNRKRKHTTVAATAAITTTTNNNNDDELQKPPKLPRTDSSAKPVEFAPPWKNLQFINCIQDKSLHLRSKVESAFNFVNSRVGDGDGDDSETIKLPRLLCFLNDWIQSLLFPSDKKPHADGFDAYIDIRCWEIFKFCLQESLKFHVTLNMSKNLLRPVELIARNALSLLEELSDCSGETLISDERLKLYDAALDCVSLVFSSHGGLSNENLGLWISTGKAVLELLLRMYDKNLDGSNMGDFALRFLWLVLQPFSKFLKVHPVRQSRFREFVDELLELLLHVSGELHLRVNGRSPIWTERAMKVVEEVLSHGLFHPVLVDEFLSLHGLQNYVASCDDASNDSKPAIQSYPRHLFDVLNKIITRKNAMAMGSVGLLFHSFVNSARKFKGTSVMYEVNKTMEKMNNSRQPVPGENSSSNNIGADTQNSLLNFFVLIMEPFLLEINTCLKSEVDRKLQLVDLHGVLKSISNLLASFMQEKVYVRTEDTSGGACLNFFKIIFNSLMNTSTNILSLSNYDTTNRKEMEIYTLSANEIIVSMGYLLEIEYEVVGEELVNLWCIMLSYSSINCNMVNVFDQCSLSSSIPALGCQIINLYSQLRQVRIAIVTLCKAIRLIISGEGNTEECSSRLTILSNEVHYESVEKLLSSQKFVHAVYKAVEAIPEGQVTGCIRQITEDISESLNWMKDFSPLVDAEKLQIFNLQVKLLGGGLSSLYCLVLDSVMVTEGNSNLVGVAVKELVSTLRSHLSTLVGQQGDSICNFLSSVLGGTVDGVVGKGKILKKFGRFSQWALVFFFQLFVSCRILLRQAISLMPPGLSKKVSAEVGDVTAYSAFELMERIDEIDTGYFTWIAQPSASLLVVLQYISDIYHKYGSDDSCPLTYVFQSMILQRLVDLDRNIELLKYLRKKRYRSRITALKEEAAGLTDLMMENLSCVYQSPVFESDDVACEDVIFLGTQSNRWNRGVYVANKNSLPTAIWLSLCKNVDIWGNHASKKHLKKFLSHLLHTSLRCERSSLQESALQKINECNKQFSGARHARDLFSQISSQLLSDSLLYEQKFIHRNLASIFCHALEKAVQPLFSNFANTDLNLQRSPNWLEYLSAIDKSAVVRDEDISIEEKTKSITNKSFTVCHHLLNLLCSMPYINASSFSCLVTCVFNLERLLVSALVYFWSSGHQDYFCKYLRLFVVCRKALRHVIMGFCEKTDTIQSSTDSIISEGSFPVLWLSKSLSVIVGIKEAFSAENSILFKSLICSLMDHTSYILAGIIKYQIIHGVSIDKEAGDLCEEISNDSSNENDSLLPSSQHLDSAKLEALKCLTLICKNLKEQTQSLVVLQKDVTWANERMNLPYADINRLSSGISCYIGIFGGLTSGMGQTDASSSEPKILLWKDLVELVDFLVSKLLVHNNQLPESFCDKSFEKPVNKFLLGTKHCSLESSVSKADNLSGTQDESKGTTCSTSSAIDNVSNIVSDIGKMLNSESKSYVASVLNKPLLQSFLKGSHPEVAFLLRQLLIASSFLLRLNVMEGNSSLLSSFVPTFIEISQVLLLEFTEMVEVPQESAFLLLDGVLSYLRELASFFSFMEPTSSRNVRTKLVQILMRAIGKTILLQGKRATLTFHERQSSTKTLHKASSEAYSSSEMYCFYLDEFKTRLRTSFKSYIMSPSELHLLSTIQDIERALVGVREECSMIYDLETSKNGGKCSSLVAAGIDFFDMILEFVSGRKGLKLIKRHCQGLVPALFNIIVHLKSPLIFYATSGTVASNLDPGPAILMCVEVLVTVSRKHAVFPMDVWHVGHLLHIPGVIFQDFNQLKISKASGQPDSSVILEDQIPQQVEGVNFSHVDRQFTIHLFVACCQLLCTTIRHRLSECKQCVAHLEASVAVLLNCLETVVDNESTVNKGCFSWEIDEGVKCACFLRRVFEEIRQQKDIFGRQCSLFLSNYIWVYTGYGPKRGGIRREIDEALRPGIYALIDICSVDDLQYLHTIFGEGPCRNTLASLQHDYKLNFKYEGKV